MDPTINSAGADKRRVRNELQSQKQVYFRTGSSSIGRIRAMRHRRIIFAAVLILLLGASAKAAPREEPKIVEKLPPLPIMLDKDFEFRKTKLFFMGEKTQ